jgi:hypothetical protein
LKAYWKCSKNRAKYTAQNLNIIKSPDEVVKNGKY